MIQKTGLCFTRSCDVMCVNVMNNPVSFLKGNLVARPLPTFSSFQNCHVNMSMYELIVNTCMSIQLSTPCSLLRLKILIKSKCTTRQHYKKPAGKQLR